MMTPFYMEKSPSAEEANYYGHYPYEIEGNYFSQENLATKPGGYRQTTVEVDSFSPNPWGKGFPSIIPEGTACRMAA